MGFFVYRNGTGTVVEKKSKFIAELAPAESEAEALAFIEKKKKTYHDARHNCSAYIVDEDGTALSRFSDDGEPSGTAGRPILDVLESGGIENAVLVVTRYFGGILLGTGGLVRAYTAAAKAAAEDASLMERRIGLLLTLSADYERYGKVEYLLREEEIPVTGTDFGEAVTFSCIVPEQKKDALAKRLRDLTAATAALEWGARQAYGIVDGETVLL